MGLIKRIIRRTSHKLLAGIGAQRRSQCLVLNQQDLRNNSVVVSGSGKRYHQARKSSSATSTNAPKRKSKHQINKSSSEAALLLAAKNHLPPVQFHHVHGETAQLSEDYFVARRRSSFCQAIVFSNRIILPNERVYIKVLELAKGWSGTIRFGFTSVDPATLRVKMPKHVCPDMTNAGHTWARALADDVVRKNSVIHFSFDKSGFIHYGINNQDCGIFCANVNTSQHLWFVVDIYGLTAAIELIDPRVRTNTQRATGRPTLNELSSHLDNEDLNALATADPNTIYKTTSAMMQENMSSGGRVRRTQVSRASLRRRFGANRAHSSNNFLLDLKSLGRHYPLDQRDYLPNIHSALFPITQQNIYSPMPMNNSHQVINGNRQEQQQPPTLRNDSHDYYQINNPYHTYASAGLPASNYYRPPPMTSANVTQASAANTSIESGNGIISNHSNLPYSLPSPSSSRRDAQQERTTSDSHQLEICHQLNGLQLNGSNDINGQSHQQSASKASKSTISTTTSAGVATTANGLPVAATRKRLQNVTNAKRDETYKTTSTNGSSKTTKASNSQANKTIKAKSSSKSITNRDNNNNNPPPTKDCPICFERPINCVLYQCGHMCTCYECGVKQWRTQSRTCPICRTVIKDVIKTYMS